MIFFNQNLDEIFFPNFSISVIAYPYTYVFNFSRVKFIVFVLKIIGKFRFLFVIWFN